MHNNFKDIKYFKCPYCNNTLSIKTREHIKEYYHPINNIQEKNNYTYWDHIKETTIVQWGFIIAVSCVITYAIYRLFLYKFF